jgi:hypothetical protein
VAVFGAEEDGADCEAYLLVYLMLVFTCCEIALLCLPTDGFLVLFLTRFFFDPATAWVFFAPKKHY